MTPSAHIYKRLALLALLVLLAVLPGTVAAQTVARPLAAPDSVAAAAPDSTQHAGPRKRLTRHAVNIGQQPDSQQGVRVVNASGDTIHFASIDSVRGLEGVEILTPPDSSTLASLGKKRIFNPDPKRALWLSALCPGLGQIYNRRYWKLPIVVGAFVGLTYGTAWNNRMLNDYTRAYRDAMDSDPATRSYMDFYPPTVKESDLDMEWLKKALKNKRNSYRRYRDICIIGMVGVYALCIIDAYVDASLAHFDISPDLTMQVRPTVVDPGTLGRAPTFGLRCAVAF